MTDNNKNIISKYVNVIASIAFTFSLFLWTNINTRLTSIQEKLHCMDKQIVQIQTKLGIEVTMDLEKKDPERAGL